MSSVFSGLQDQLSGIRSRDANELQDEKDKANAAIKKFKEGKEIEEAGGAAKLLYSTKGLGEALQENTTKIIKRQLKQGWKQFRDKWAENAKQRLQDEFDKRMPAGESPVNPIKMGEIGEIDDEPEATPEISEAEETAAAANKIAKTTEQQAFNDDELGTGKVGESLNPFSSEDSLVTKPVKDFLAKQPVRDDFLSDLPEETESSLGAESRSAAKLALRKSVAGLKELGVQQQETQALVRALPNQAPIQVAPPAVPSSTAGSAAQAEEAEAAKAAAKAAQEEEDKALAARLAKQTAKDAVEKDGEEEGSATLLEGLGLDLDSTGIGSIIGVPLGIAGLAIGSRMKKIPKLGNFESPDLTRTSQQAGYGL